MKSEGFSLEPPAEQIHGYESLKQCLFLVNFIYIRKDSPYYLVDRFFPWYSIFDNVFTDQLDVVSTDCVIPSSNTLLHQILPDVSLKTKQLNWLQGVMLCIQHLNGSRAWFPSMIPTLIWPEFSDKNPSFALILFFQWGSSDIALALYMLFSVCTALLFHCSLYTLASVG